MCVCGDRVSLRLLIRTRLQNDGKMGLNSTENTRNDVLLGGQTLQLKSQERVCLYDRVSGTFQTNGPSAVQRLSLQLRLREPNNGPSALKMSTLA